MGAISRLARLPAAALVVLGLAGCLEDPKSNVRPGVSFHLVGKPGCAGCKQLPGSAFNGYGQQTYFLQPAYIRDREIEYVALIGDDASTLAFEFTPAAAQRILRVSTDNQGKPAALVADGKVLSVATIAGPYSESLAFLGSPADQKFIYDAITIPGD